jgi:thymidylate kinase
MADTDGALIVLEGTSENGVTKQYELLSKKLQSQGYDVLELRFPQLDSESSYFVRQYLDDTFGPRDETSPYVASLYYALDKHAAARDIKQALERGAIVLCTGYASSVMATEGKKFTKPEERRGFFVWYDNVVHQMLGLPRPSRALILLDPAEKGSSSDTHTDAYLDVCALFPKDVQRIDTARNNKPIESDTLHNQIWYTVSQLLPQKPEPEVEPTTPVTSEKLYIIPPDLPNDVKESYIQTLDAVLETQQQLRHKLEEYLLGMDEPDAAAKAQDVARLLLPASSKTAFTQVPKQVVTNGSHAASAETANSLELLSYTPRNEMEAARLILEEKGDKKALAAYDKLTYTEKAEIIHKYLADKSTKSSKKPAFAAVTYTFRLIGTFADYVTLAAHATKTETENLSPRLGFDVPEILDDAGLTDQYEASFNASFALFSLMQKHGLHDQAQYATLLGHKLQATLTFTLSNVMAIQADNNLNQLSLTLERLREVHPLLTADR